MEIFFDCSRLVGTNNNGYLPRPHNYEWIKTNEKIFCPPLLWAMWAYKNRYFHLDFRKEMERFERLTDIYKNGLARKRNGVNPASVKAGQMFPKLHPKIVCLVISLPAHHGRRELLRPRNRRKRRDPLARKASRKFSGSRIWLWKTTAGLFYEAPNLEALGVMRPLGAFGPGAIRPLPSLRSSCPLMGPTIQGLQR